MSQGDRLRLLARAAGYEHLSEFAEAAGIKPGTAQQQANRNSIPRSAAKKYIARAHATGADVEWLLDGAGTPPRQMDATPFGQPSQDMAEAVAVFLPPPNAHPAPDAPPPPQRTEMPRDVPVLGTALGGDLRGLAEFQLNGQVVDYVRRPPRIAGRKDVFVVYMSGTSMSPWRKPGQMVYLESAKPPSITDHVLIELKPTGADDSRGALVKQLVAINPTKIKLHQYTPAKDFEIDRRLINNIFRVLDWDELMAV